MIAKRDYDKVPKTWNDEIILVSTSNDVDDEGFPIVGQPTETTVLTNRMPVNSSEFYQSNKEGYTISEAFEIHTIEYNGEQTLLFEGNEYRIRRTYRKEVFTELYCERKDERP